MPGRHEAEIKLRLSEKLRRKIERAAARNKHSMNAEILKRLEDTFGAEAFEITGYAQRYRDQEYLSEIRARMDAFIKSLEPERDE